VRSGSWITENHPLRRLFAGLVQRRFLEDMHLRSPRLAAYIVNLLVDFTRTENLYRIRNAQGRRLDDVAEMLIESNPLLEGRSFDYEREVRKHIGDYTLFMTGLFPESVALSRRQRQNRLDAFIDYIKAGKESYAIVSAFDQFEYATEAPLFRELSEKFELSVFGLNLVKQDLERLQRDYYRRVQSILQGTEKDGEQGSEVNQSESR